ncbi:unnamed protein product [Lymnaea stagnalis]|uniref:Uncharacterized protein n=1 Tax=Lymnaea stagnalis TaxID=6523 RepID=A0AAV2IDT8_LYMST
MFISICAARNRGKIKWFRLKSGVPYNSITNQVASVENEIYANLRVLNTNQHCENAPSEANVVTHVDTRNPARDRRVYMNTGEIHDAGSSIGAGHDPFSSLETDHNSDRLVYVTISQCESLTASSGPRSHERNDEVVYASLDFTKSGRLSVKDMERLVKKNSRRQRRSMKKSASRNESGGKMLSLQEHCLKPGSLENLSKRSSL